MTEIEQKKQEEILNKIHAEEEQQPVKFDLDWLLNEIKQYNPKANFKLIEKAYNFAMERHKGHKRESGEEYFMHPYEVTKILIKLKADSATICAALLHDVVEDSNVSLATIKKEFGEEIKSLVEGVTKPVGVKDTKEEYKAETIRKILISTAKDIRVMLIKLADRLHNMRTLKYFRDDKRRRISKETLQIYAPIANKLGIRFIKGELEDLSLKYLNPEAYYAIRTKIAEKRVEREAKAKEIISRIHTALKENGVEAEVYGRAKYFYSIYQKMVKKGRDFSEIYDLIGIRIIVKTVPECYHALGVLHDLWKPIPGKFKDYIAVPKANGYQSLHTLVIGDFGKILEIQIRTKEMNDICEEGIAAHWRYKGDERDKKFDRKLAWLKQILEWKRDSDTATEFVENLKIDFFQNEIVVFTPKGDPISLPEGATPVDFAYEVHTNIGHHCSKSLVNGNIAPLDHILKSGDIVEIITKNDAKPSRNWLSFVKSSKARSKIKSKLNIKIETSDSKDEKTKQQKEIELLSLLDIDVKKSLVKFSKCCRINYKDRIAAYLMKDKRITIHNVSCPNIHAIAGGKQIETKWLEKPEEEVKVRITVQDRVGVLSDILKKITDMGVNINTVYTKSHKDKITIRFGLHELNEDNIKKVFSELKKIENVLDINRE